MADGTPPEVRLIPRAKIDPDPGNPRRGSPDEVFNTDDLASIRTLGITTPLLVEPRSGRFRIIDGERRYLKAGEVELDELPCIVRDDLTEDDVLAIQLATYSSQPLPPLREAAALERLRLSLPAPATAADVAERLGKSARLVRQRLVLLQLIPAAQELLAGGRITLGLALRIAGLSPEGQEGPAQEAKRRGREGGDPLGVHDLSYELGRALLRLRDGGFPLDDATLVPSAGTCTSCPHKSGNQAALFADGLADAELCTRAKCFEGKQAAQAARITAAAKTSGVPVIDKAPEVKKLFPYGGSLGYGSPYVDLDTTCDLVQPKGEAAKNQGRHGGPEKCTEAEGHNFEQGEEWSAEDFEDQGPGAGDENAGCAAAHAAGCAAWVTCDRGCGAWQEIDARPGAPPAGWKPPTWREALAGALAKMKPGAPKEDTAPRPALVVIVEGKGHELVEKKAALAMLRTAGVIDKRDEQSEIRNVKAPKKPGELDKFEVERKASAAADEEVLGAVVAKAEKKPGDAKFWRFVVGMVLRSVVGGELGAAVKRRQIVVDEKGRKHANSEEPEEKALLAWVAAQKEEGPLRALAVELLIGDSGLHKESALDVAARFYGVDAEALVKAATERIKAEAKAKAKLAAEKAAKKKPKASPAKGKARRPTAISETTSAASPSPSWKCAACGCTYEHACVDGAGECEEVGDVCSVCDRAAKIVLKLCAKKQSEGAVLSALYIKQQRKDAPETFDKARAQAVVAYLEQTGAIARTNDKKLLASQPVA